MNSNALRLCRHIFPALLLAALAFAPGSSAKTPPAARLSLHGIIRLNGPSQSLAFSRNGRLLACSTFELTTPLDSPHPPVWRASLSLWDTKSCRLICRVPVETQILGLAISPDGRSIAALEFSPNTPGTTQVTLRDAKSLAVTHRFSHASPHYAEGLAFSPNGRILAVGDRIGKGRGKPGVRLYSVSSGRTVRNLLGMDFGATMSTAFSQDGAVLAAVTVDREDGDSDLAVWDVKSGRLLKRLSDDCDSTKPEREWQSMSFNWPVVFLPGSRTLVCGNTLLDVSKKQLSTRILWQLAVGRRVIGVYPS